jgi:integrase
MERPWAEKDRRSSGSQLIVPSRGGDLVSELHASSNDGRSGGRAARARPRGPRRLHTNWAVYAGLRRGELQALDWSDVELDAGVIHVRSSWDQLAGRAAPKTKTGARVVPIASVLDKHLRQLAAASGGVGLVFGRASDEPFAPVTVNRRAQRTWKRAGLNPIGLHECRHTFVSFMIAAGVNPKALSTYMGHASVTITFDLYGHLMPGNEQQAARLLDAYLRRSTRAAAKTRENDRRPERSTAASSGDRRFRSVGGPGARKSSKPGHIGTG